MAADTQERAYSQEQVDLIAREAAKAAVDSLLRANLDNRIENASSDTLEGKGISRVPPKRLQAKVIVNDGLPGTIPMRHPSAIPKPGMPITAFVTASSLTGTQPTTSATPAPQYGVKTAYRWM